MPELWENRIFRADFLAYLDGSGYRETVERFGSLLAALVREHANYLPPSQEPVAVCELWSVAEDLRHTEAHLRWIADSPNENLVEREEARLCEVAGGLAEEVAALVARIEGRVGKRKPRRRRRRRGRR